MNASNPIELIKGYVMWPRDLRDQEWAEKPPHVREILYLILEEVNHTDKTSSGRLIKRGQYFTTYKEIQDRLKWKVGWKTHTYSTAQVETALKVLQRTGLITIRRTTRGMLITFCNYDYYQTPKNYRSQSINQSTDETETRAQTTQEPEDNESINEFIKKEKHKGGAASLPSLEEGESGAPQAFEGEKPLPTRNIIDELPFPSRWKQFITYLSYEDPPIYAVLASLKKIEDYPELEFTKIVGTVATVNQAMRDKHEIEEMAGKFFNERVSLSPVVMTQNNDAMAAN